MAQGGRAACFQVFRYQDARLCDRETFFVNDCGDAAGARAQFVLQYYQMRDRVPPVVVLDEAPADRELLTQFLTEKRGGAVKLFVPQRGTQRQLAEMCRTNAAEQLAQSMGTGGREMSALDELARLLGLSAPPLYIESYDISNTAGSQNVAGMVVFENGRPLKSAYRRFKIQTVTGQDDYGSMREVIRRRFEEYKAARAQGAPEEGFGRLPDLILLDGGAGHVAAVAPVLEAMGIDVPLFGMVKDDSHRTRAITGDGGEIAISSTRQAFTLVSSIQDEVHRFAIGYHKQRRSKAAVSGTLTRIPGIGETRAKNLLKHFRTISAIREATLEELRQAPGMTEPAARAVYEYFLNEHSD